MEHLLSPRVLSLQNVDRGDNDTCFFVLTAFFFSRFFVPCTGSNQGTFCEVVRVDCFGDVYCVYCSAVVSSIAVLSGVSYNDTAGRKASVRVNLIAERNVLCFSLIYWLIYSALPRIFCFGNKSLSNNSSPHCLLYTKAGLHPGACMTQSRMSMTLL